MKTIRVCRSFFHCKVLALLLLYEDATQQKTYIRRRLSDDHTPKQRDQL